nr:MAG TPA: hypothetical protein [Caudoviricetes sp.]
MASNYVKFLRGTPAAYAKLPVKDKDTLYFISEKDSEKGILYLGSKIIAGGGAGSGGAAVTSLKDLTDVLLGEGIAANSFLVYDETDQKWKNKTVEEVAPILQSIFKGATETEAGTSGLVPVPQIGQQDFVLLGSGQWSSGLKDLKATVKTLVGTDEEKSVREISNEVIGTRVGDLKSLLEKVKDLTDFTDVTNRLVAVEGKLNVAEGNITDITTRVTKIEKNLEWQELEE